MAFRAHRLVTCTEGLSTGWQDRRPARGGHSPHAGEGLAAAPLAASSPTCCTAALPVLKAAGQELVIDVVFLT